MKSSRIAVGLIVLAAGLAFASSANAAAGGLTQKAGTAGCISDSGGTCADGHAMLSLAALAISPDGTSAYGVAPGSLSVTIYDRDPATGELTQKAAEAGCITDTGSDGCADGTAMQAPSGVTVSPDGKNVYVAVRDDGAVLVFDRNTTTGALTQKAGTAGCISESGNGGECVNGSGLDGAADVDVSPDGKSVYVSAAVSDGIAVFDRDTTTGALTQKAGTAGCISDSGAGGCADGAALDNAFATDISADGKSLYVASFNSDSVGVFDRDTTTGALTQKAGTAGCISEFGGDGCADGVAINGPQSVAVSPDGSSLYVASGVSSAVTVFDRSTGTGALTQKAGTAACISESGADGCVDGNGLLTPGSVDVSPDGATAYVASAGSSSVTTFDRAAGGALTQRPGTAGCIADIGTPGACADGAAMTAASFVTLDPDGRNVYVVAQGASAIDVFDRDVAPDTTIDTGPTGTIADPTPTFTFSSTEVGSTFECKLDAGAFAPCSGPGASHTTAELVNGAHTFSVRAVDPAANADPTPATRAFTVDVPDTTAPETTITKQPKSKVKTKGKTATVQVSFSSEAGASFECRLDEKDFNPCTSPFSAKAKSKGGKGLKHTIEVRATDAASNVEATPAVASFRVIRK